MYVPRVIGVHLCVWACAMNGMGHWALRMENRLYPFLTSAVTCHLPILIKRHNTCTGVPDSGRRIHDWSAAVVSCVESPRFRCLPGLDGTVRRDVDA